MFPVGRLSVRAIQVRGRAAATEIAEWVGKMRQQQLEPDGATYTSVMQEGM